MKLALPLVPIDDESPEGPVSSRTSEASVGIYFPGALACLTRHESRSRQGFALRDDICSARDPYSN
jgi:hypothetical protein